MPVDAHYSVELQQAFIAGEAELKKLVDLLSDRIGNLEIRADCADNVSRTFKSVKELEAFENPRGREIRRLLLSARSDDYKKRATIDLSSRWLRGISLEFVARDDIVSRLRTEVLDILGGMRPWYAVLQRINFVYIALFAYVLLWLILLLVVALNRVEVNSSKESGAKGAAQASLLVYGMLVVMFAAGFVLNRFRDVCFPRAIFLIGQGKARFQHLERIQWGVIISFVISFAAGIVIAVWQAIAA